MSVSIGQEGKIFGVWTDDFGDSEHRGEWMDCRIVDVDGVRFIEIATPFEEHLHFNVAELREWVQ